MKKQLTLFLLIIFAFSACQKSGTFSVQGNISNAEGEMLYVLHQGLTKETLIDSAKLDKDGAFHFRIESPKYPDFYLLRVKGNQIVLAVDSIEKIDVQANYPNILTAKFNNSPQSEVIQQHRQSVLLLQSKIDTYNAEADKVKKEMLKDSLLVQLDMHKKSVQKDLLSTSHLLSTYYALFQQIGGNFIFSPYEKDDLRYFRALATSFDTFMPEYGRSKNLYAIAMNAIAAERKSRETNELFVEKSKQALGYINIKLKDRNGYYKELSDLQGNPIVVDFSAYTLENAQTHIFDLQELYDAYHEKGLKIYQVSLDENRFLWEQAASNKAWICVHDEDMAFARLYNIKEVPTLFVIDREGNIVGRYNTVKQTEKRLKKLF